MAQLLLLGNGSKYRACGEMVGDEKSLPQGRGA